MIKSNHNAGFFSNCSVRLHKIVEFINSNKKLPDGVDTSQSYKRYKLKDDINNDVTFHYFQHYNEIENIEIPLTIDYTHRHQFIEYAKLDYKCITPLIKKYFSPSSKINETINNIEKKYNIMHENTVAVYYRGTDKYRETKLASFDDFYNQIIKIININKDINILLQSDCAKFIDYINNKNLKNVVIIDENKTSYNNNGIHHEQSCSTNYQDMFYFLSTIVILSKCKYIICSSGNCSIWIMFYRGNNANVIQNLNGGWNNSVF